MSVLTVSSSVLAAPITIEETLKLSANDASAHSVFGFSVALAGDTAVVGATTAEGNRRQSGAAYIFDATTGEQTQKLQAVDGARHDNFGVSVALSGQTVVVGASARDTDGDGSSEGEVFVFDAETGDLNATYTNEGSTSADSFGRSVALTEETLIVGAHNAVHDSRRANGQAMVIDRGTGAQTQLLQAEDPKSGHKFGLPVAASEGTAVVGAFLDDQAGAGAGAAYVYDTTTGAQSHKLQSNDIQAGDYFGRSVDISGDRILVGAYGEDTAGDLSGAAYVFDLFTGQEVLKLTPEEGSEADFFGVSVAVEGSLALIGASQAGLGGAAYLFDIETGEELAMLEASDALSGANFGASVDLSGGLAIVGAQYWNNSTGAAYIYDISSFVPSSPAPVPLPAGVWMLASAMGLLLLRRRGTPSMIGA